MYEAMKCDTVRMRMAIDISVVLIFGNGGLGLASIDGAVRSSSRAEATVTSSSETPSSCTELPRRMR